MVQVRFLKGPWDLPTLWETSTPNGHSFHCLWRPKKKPKGGFHKWGFGPLAGWCFFMENPTQMGWWLGVASIFRTPPYFAHVFQMVSLIFISMSPPTTPGRAPWRHPRSTCRPPGCHASTPRSARAAPGAPPTSATATADICGTCSKKSWDPQIHIKTHQNTMIKPSHLSICACDQTWDTPTHVVWWFVTPGNYASFPAMVNLLEDLRWMVNSPLGWQSAWYHHFS